MLRYIRFLSLTALLSIGATAQAAPPDGPPPHPHELIRDQAAELGIDEPTVQSIMTIAEQARPEMERLQGELQQAGQQLHVLLEAESPDREAIMRQVELVGEIQIDLQQHQIGTLLSIRALLSPEQLQALEQLAGMSGGHHPPPPPGMAPPGAPPPPFPGL